MTLRTLRKFKVKASSQQSPLNKNRPAQLAEEKMQTASASSPQVSASERENVFNRTKFSGESDGFGADGTRAYGEKENSGGYGARPSGPDFQEPLQNPVHPEINPYADGNVLRRLALQAEKAGAEALQRHQDQSRK